MADQSTFDVQGALNAGASEDDVLAHLTATRPFDVKGATAAGASKSDIIHYLASTPRKNPDKGFAESFADTTGIPQMYQEAKNAPPPPPRSAGQVVGDAVKEGAMDAFVRPYSTAWKIGKSIVGNAYQHMGAAGGALMRGDIPGAAKEYAGMVPVFGPMAYEAGNQAEQGNWAGAAGTATGAILQAAAPEIAERVPQAGRAVARAAASPGAPKIIGGVTDMTAGAGAMATHSPIGVVYGAASVARGLNRIIKGIAERKAAAIEATEEAASKVPPPNQFTGPRNPAWASISDGPSPEVAPFSGAEGVSLPSGRVPGTGQPAAPAPTMPMRNPAWKSIPDVTPTAPQSAPVSSPAALPSGRIPGRPKPQAPTMPPPEPTVAPTPAPEPQAAAATPVSPQESSRRAALAKDLAKVLHNNGQGVSATDAAQFMDDSHWNEAAKAVDIMRGTPKGAPQRVKAPSSDTRSAAIEELKKLESMQTVKEQLRDAMSATAAQ